MPLLPLSQTELAFSAMGVHRTAEFARAHVPAFTCGVDAEDWLVVYPFNRSYDWYLMDPAKRGALLREHGLNLQAYAREHWWIALVAFVAVYALATASTIPGPVFLTLLGGMMFGPVVGMLALLTPWKGHGVLLDAIARSTAIPLGIVDGLSAPGLRVALRADTDVLVLVSNCPQINNPCNGFDPTPVRMIVTRPS